MTEYTRDRSKKYLKNRGFTNLSSKQREGERIEKMNTKCRVIEGSEDMGMYE